MGVKKKKVETSKKKPSNPGLKLFLFIVFIGVSGYFLGVYRNQVKEVYVQNSPVLVNGIREGYTHTKRGVDLVMPRVNQFFDNMGKNIDDFVERMTTSRPIPRDETKK